MAECVRERTEDGEGDVHDVLGIGSWQEFLAPRSTWRWHLAVAAVCQQLMNIFTYGKVLAWSNQRSLDALKAGKTPGPEMSLSKMGLTRQMQATCNFVSDVLETRLVADTGEWGTFSWGGYVLGQPAMRIAGGSDEVMRNIVGERVLGLPKEPGIDTTSPFRELKVGTQRSE